MNGISSFAMTKHKSNFRRNHSREETSNFIRLLINDATVASSSRLFLANDRFSVSSLLHCAVHLWHGKQHYLFCGYLSLLSMILNSSSNYRSFFILPTNLTPQRGHDAFVTFVFIATQPTKRLILVVELSLPLFKSNVSNLTFVSLFVSSALFTRCTFAISHFKDRLNY